MITRRFQTINPSYRFNKAVNIGLLGGTYDPVHCGHVSIARSFLDSNFIDQLWILLTPTPPHKKDRSFTPYKDRLHMLEMAFKSIDDIIVSDVEQHLEEPQYTFKTVKYLSNANPEVTFYLCLGEDGYLSFDHWYKFEKILQRCELLVAQRPGFRTKQQDHVMIRDKAHFIDHEPVDISSTCIRKKVQRGDDIVGLVPKNVESYIKDQDLYQV